MNNALPSIVQRIKDYCESCPHGQLVNSIALATILGTTPKYLREWSSHPAIQPFKTRGSEGNFWGAAKTIKEFNKEKQ